MKTSSLISTSLLPDLVIRLILIFRHKIANLRLIESKYPIIRNPMSEQEYAYDRQLLSEHLQSDLLHEINHMMFYLRAATEVEGLHREELREFFMKEAHEEMGHVHEFADMISYFGKPVYFSPTGPSLTERTPPAWAFGHNPYTILEEAIAMEQVVAANYALRLHQTEGSRDPWVATLHVFYEDQIKNSQMTAWELKKWLTKFPATVTVS
jgi:bacterioferritin